MEYGSHICHYCEEPIDVTLKRGRIPIYHEKCRKEAYRQRNKERKKEVRELEKLDKFILNLPKKTKENIYNLTFEKVKEDLDNLKEFNRNYGKGFSWIQKLNLGQKSDYDGIDYMKNISLIVEIIKNSKEIREYIKSIVIEEK